MKKKRVSYGAVRRVRIDRKQHLVSIPGPMMQQMGVGDGDYVLVFAEKEGGGVRIRPVILDYGEEE